MSREARANMNKAVELCALAEQIRRIEGGFGNPLSRGHVSTGIDALDAKLSGRGLATGAIHELWSCDEGSGLWTVATWFLRQGAARGGYILWFDSRNDFYPPAAQSCGIDLSRLVLVRPRDRKQMLWGIGHALRCRGISAVVGMVSKPTLAEVRRLQLAAETGGGLGFLLATRKEDVSVGGIATRWKITGAPSNGDARCIAMELEKCRGGHAAPPIMLEAEHGQIRVAVSSRLADRPDTADVADSSAA